MGKERHPCLAPTTVSVTTSFSWARKMTTTPVSATWTFCIGTADSASAEDVSTPAPSSPSVPLSASPCPVQASKHRSKALRQGSESIRFHPTDPTKLIVTYHVTVDGKPYYQKTEIPKVIPMPADVPSSGDSVIFPNVEASTVPRTPKSSPWTPVPGSAGYEWTRGEGDEKKAWRINIFFRRLSRDTHAFEDIYVNVNHLKNVDPNNSTFRTVYNKWVLQIARRQDANYTQKVARVHWNAAERRALYTAINAFCARFGIHRFGFADECKLSTNALQMMADAVNAAPNPSRCDARGIDAVRGQITSAHNKSPPKNKAVFDLLAQSTGFRARMAAGEVIPKAVRKPKAAISRAEFPLDTPVPGTPRSTPDSKKRKRTAAVEETEPPGSELSSPAVSELGESCGSREDTEMTADEEAELGESGDGQWVEVEEPRSKKARRT